MTTIETTRSDSQFCQEVIDLIDGTHWTKGHLETSCPVYLPKGMPAPRGQEIKTMYLTYHKKARMEYRCDYQQWLYTLPSQRDMMPRMTDYGAEDIYIADHEVNHYTRATTYADPVVAYTYYKSQWCLVGMCLKVGSLSTRSEDPLYDNDTDVALRNAEHAQIWRVIDQIAFHIDEERRIDEASGTASRTIEYVEGWNDQEDTTKEDVRAVVVKARDHFKRGEAS